MKCAFDDGPCYYRGPNNSCTRGEEKCLYFMRHPEKLPAKNNEQIDNTSYYKLPCGLYLEDYIFAKGLNFAEGSALKYKWRAGNKDGETAEKDLAKCMHYCEYLARKGAVDTASVVQEVDDWCKEAIEWDGIAPSIKAKEK